MKNKGEYVTGEAYLLFKGAQNDIINIVLKFVPGTMRPWKKRGIIQYGDPLIACQKYGTFISWMRNPA